MRSPNTYFYAYTLLIATFMRTPSLYLLLCVYPPYTYFYAYTLLIPTFMRIPSLYIGLPTFMRIPSLYLLLCVHRNADGVRNGDPCMRDPSISFPIAPHQATSLQLAF